MSQTYELSNYCLNGLIHLYFTQNNYQQSANSLSDELLSKTGASEKVLTALISAAGHNETNGKRKSSGKAT